MVPYNILEMVNHMSEKFIKPEFSKGNLEFRVENDEVSIYGNTEGLTWLAQKCLVLVDRKKQQHLHLEEYHVLTPKSNRAVIALFPDK